MDPARPVPFGVSRVDPTVAPKQTWPLPSGQGARPVTTGQWIPGESQGRCLGHRDDQVSVHLEKRKLPPPSAREEPEGPSERIFPALLQRSPPSWGSLLWLVRSPLQPAAKGSVLCCLMWTSKKGVRLQGSPLLLSRINVYASPQRSCLHTLHFTALCFWFRRIGFSSSGSVAHCQHPSLSAQLWAWWQAHGPVAIITTQIWNGPFFAQPQMSVCPRTIPYSCLKNFL